MASCLTAMDSAAPPTDTPPSLFRCPTMSGGSRINSTEVKSSEVAKNIWVKAMEDEELEMFNGKFECKEIYQSRI